MSRTPSLTERIQAALVDRIQRGDLEQGTLYSVYELAEDMGVSRTPVRDALLKLEEAGIVAFAKNRGFRLVPARADDIVDIFAIRIALEVPASHRAARGADPELIGTLRGIREHMRRAARAGDVAAFFEHDERLHAAIILHGSTQRVSHFIQRLRITTRLLGAQTVHGDRTLEEVLEEHEPLLLAIEDGDATGAATAMRAHLEHTGMILARRALRSEGDERDADAVWRDGIDGY